MGIDSAPVKRGGRSAAAGRMIRRDYITIAAAGRTISAKAAGGVAKLLIYAA
jgi:hypothetical protein